MTLHCPRCNAPVQSGSTRCPGCEFAFRPSGERDYTKIITVCFLLFVLVPAMASIFISLTREPPPISSSAETSSLDKKHETPNPASPKDFKLTIPTPEGGNLVKEVIVTDDTLTWKTSFPSGTKAFVVFEKSLPADTSNVGIIPLHLISNESYEISIDGDIFYSRGNAIYGPAYACLFVIDNNAWDQSDQTKKIIQTTKDQLSCIDEISNDQADAIIRKVRLTEFPLYIQNRLDPFLYRETLAGYRLAIIKKVDVPL